MGFSWNRKRIEDDARDSRTRGGGLTYLMLGDGERATGRFMPIERPAPGQEAELYVRYAHHYIRDIKLYAACVDQPAVADYVPKGWTCGFCALWKELRASKDPDDQEEAKKYNVSVRFASNIRLASGEMRVFRYSVKTQPKLVELAFGSEYSDILDLTDGRDVEIVRKGDAFDTDYMIMPQKRTSTVPDDALDDLHDVYATIDVLPPAKVAQVLKGYEPSPDELLTLRDLMTAKGQLGKAYDAASYEQIVAAAAAGALVAAVSTTPVRPAAVAPAPSADADREPTRAERKRLRAIGDELDFDVDLDNAYKDIVDALVTEAVDLPTKKLSEDCRAFLESNGCDVSGKLVVRAASPAVTSEPDGDETTEIERQIQAVRARRAAAGKTKR